MADRDHVHTPTVQDGYRWLEDHIGAEFKKLLGLQVAPTSEIAANDSYLDPIRRTYEQDVVECLVSALDHMEFLVWSLKSREEPHPYAHFTLIRTAITAASTAMWLLCGATRDERRVRVLEFCLKDIRAYVDWIGTVSVFPKNQVPSDAEKDEIDKLTFRQAWIVEQANALLKPTKPLTPATFARRTSDTEMVRIAGAETPALGLDGYDPAANLLSAWKSLSGYAHARPWSAVPGRHVTGTDPSTGRYSAIQKGDPNRMLDAAFRGMLVIEEAVRRLVELSTARPDQE